jgi:hypothetical protein
MSVAIKPSLLYSFSFKRTCRYVCAVHDNNDHDSVSGVYLQGVSYCQCHTDVSSKSKQLHLVVSLQHVAGSVDTLDYCLAACSEEQM